MASESKMKTALTCLKIVINHVKSKIWFVRVFLKSLSIKQKNPNKFISLSTKAMKSSFFLAYLHKSTANSPSVHTFSQGTSAADFVPSWLPLLCVEVSPSESQGLDLHGRNNYSVRQRVRETAWEGISI